MITLQKNVLIIIAVDSPACNIWIVNDITDCNTCLFSVSGFIFSLFQNSMYVCISVCV